MPFLSPGIPVLHRRVLDLGVVERDQLDHGGVELVLVAHRRGAAFEVADVGALVGDDQRALELAGVRGVDAEVGRQLHRAAHALRHVAERAVGEHRRVERREEVVADRHHRAEVLLHQFGCSCTASENEQKITPVSPAPALNVVATETESNDRVDRERVHAGQISCSLSEMPSLSYVAQQLGIDFVQARGRLRRLGRRVVMMSW